MRVLLDTCVLAELRHPLGDPAVRDAVKAVSDQDLFVSVITTGEIVKGIALLPNGTKKEDLSRWLLGLYRTYGGHILPIDRETAEIWGEITARARRQGEQIPIADGLIAATALRHGLHVMTRNSEYFSASGALTINPWPAI